MDETDLGQLPVGKPLSRDLIGDHAPGEHQERELDWMMSRREKERRRAGEGDAANMTEEEWQRSCEEHARKLEEERRYAWHEYYMDNHMDMIRKHTHVFESLIDYHRRQLGFYDEQDNYPKGAA
jgi:hypothetical protein